MTYARKIYEERPAEEACGCRWTWRLTAEGDYEGTIESCDAHHLIAIRHANRVLALEAVIRELKARLGEPA